MNAPAKRVFEDKQAQRGPTPLLFGLIGPSGSGKTYSALRLATGMKRATGGEIFVIDTEADRAKHYANLFSFRHVTFSAPFSPSDYKAAIEHCLKKGAKTIIVDSMSHEHEGPGGVLEWHQREVERIMAAWRCNEEKANVPAWGKPKASRRELINFIIQAKCNFIFCFRAKDKVKLGGGKVTQLGFMPIAGEEFVYELTAKSLLLPGAMGVPTWQSQQPGEKLMIKLPEQFSGLFSGAQGKSLDEEVGQSLARWANGEEIQTPSENLIAQYTTCTDRQRFQILESKREALWKSQTINKGEQTALKAASDAAAKRIEAATAAQSDQAGTWVATLQGAKSLEQLEQIREDCLQDLGGLMPPDCDDAYNTRREQLS